MLFSDHLHGTIDFRGTPYENLIFELLGCPEVQRLRHMRLMNFDVPYIQDLASTKRLPHSIGTCYLAYRIVEKSAKLAFSQKKNNNSSCSNNPRYRNLTIWTFIRIHYEIQEILKFTHENPGAFDINREHIMLQIYITKYWVLNLLACIRF